MLRKSVSLPHPAGSTAVLLCMEVEVPQNPEYVIGIGIDLSSLLLLFDHVHEWRDQVLFPHSHRPSMHLPPPRDRITPASSTPKPLNARQRYADLDSDHLYTHGSFLGGGSSSLSVPVTRVVCVCLRGAATKYKPNLRDLSDFVQAGRRVGFFLRALILLASN